MEYPHDYAIRAYHNSIKRDLDDLEGRMMSYIKNTPKLYERFSHFVWEMIFAGRSKVSARMVVERLRWESEVRGEGRFKIDNDCVPFLARKFIQDNPQCVGLFETRERKNHGTL